MTSVMRHSLEYATRCNMYVDVHNNATEEFATQVMQALQNQPEWEM